MARPGRPVVKAPGIAFNAGPVDEPEENAVATTPLHYQSLMENSARIHRGEIRSREVTGALLKRIDALDPWLHAFSLLIPDAADEPGLAEQIIETVHRRLERASAPAGGRIRRRFAEAADGKDPLTMTRRSRRPRTVRINEGREPCRINVPTTKTS